MKIRSVFCSLVAGAALLCIGGVQASSNVALGKTVTLTDGSIDPGSVPLSTLTDGSFVGTGTFYQSGTVFWQTSNGPIFELDLGGIFSISSIKLEHDNNDSYLAFYPVGNSVSFVSFTNPNGGGMATSVHTFLSPVTASKLTFIGLAGDGLYSLSEIQVTAVPIPEPGSYAMMLAGLALMGGVAARRKSRGGA